MKSGVREPSGREANSVSRQKFNYCQIPWSLLKYNHRVSLRFLLRILRH